MEKLIRQGDVLLVRVAELPKNAVIAASKTVVEGELTGHHHIVYGAEVMVSDNDLFVVSDGLVSSLKHQNVMKAHQWTGDHFDIKIPAGIFKVVAQRQYDYSPAAQERIRRAKD